MRDVGGLSLIAVSAGMVVVSAVWVRLRAPRMVVDALVAVSAAGVAIGGLMLLDDVATISWIAAPVALAAASVLHVRALFAGSGPFRT